MQGAECQLFSVQSCTDSEQRQSVMVEITLEYGSNFTDVRGRAIFARFWSDPRHALRLTSREPKELTK